MGSRAKGFGSVPAALVRSYLLCLCTFLLGRLRIVRAWLGGRGTGSQIDQATCSVLIVPPPDPHPAPPPSARAQALPVRMLAMGATAIAANVPCGMWREHTKKFSPEWFLVGFREPRPPSRARFLLLGFCCQTVSQHESC